MSAEMEQETGPVAEAVAAWHGSETAEPNGHGVGPAIDGQAEKLEERELKAILEALLFVSADPIPISKFVSLLGTVPKAEIEASLRSLREDFDRDGKALQLVEIAGGYRMVTKQEYAPWVKRLDKSKAAPKLSRSALESLAIIAYKQPLVRAEIEEIRGVETSGVLRTLLERKLVRIVGRKEVPGRPIMYGTTKFFLEHFGLRDLSELPPLREFKELGESDQVLLPLEGREAADQADRAQENEGSSPHDELAPDQEPNEGEDQSRLSEELMPEPVEQA